MTHIQITDVEERVEMITLNDGGEKVMSTKQF